MRLLLVEDEELLSKAISKGLRRLGYAVDCAFDGEEAFSLYELNEYDLMILDLNLPKIDGMEVLQMIREKDPHFRVIILSARDTVLDKIEGLDGGANDYLTKPFAFPELEARIRNLLRQEVQLKDTELSCGVLRVNMAKKTVTIAEHPLDLTRKEYAILEFLLYHQERFVGAEELVEHVWDRDADPFSNAFRFHIHSLRKKLETRGAGGYIVTHRGMGYRIVKPEGTRT